MTGDLKSDLLRDFVQYYAEGFRTGNVALIDKIVRYPIAYISNGGVTFHDNFPIDPLRLQSEKGFDHSSDSSFQISAINEREAHASAQSTRRRKDGSKIEDVHGFYAFTLTEDGWKLYAISDVISNAYRQSCSRTRENM